MGVVTRDRARGDEKVREVEESTNPICFRLVVSSDIDRMSSIEVAKKPRETAMDTSTTGDGGYQVYGAGMGRLTH